MGPEELKKILINKYEWQHYQSIKLINDLLEKVTHVDEKPITIICDFAFVEKFHPIIIFYYKNCGWSDVMVENISLPNKIATKIVFSQ